MAQSAVAVSIPGTDDQFAAREMVRDWAASSKAIEASRAIEQGTPEAWRGPYDGLAQLGIFGVAIAEGLGGAGGTVEDLCAMVDEAAAALVPGPVAPTALATLVITDESLLDALASGARTAGVALRSDIVLDGGTATGTAPFVLGGLPDAVLLLPAGEQWIVVDAAADGVTVEQLEATDFSRPLARVRLESATATVLDTSAERLTDLAATVLAAEAAGLARWM
ncbi:MAG: acyl-CoA dehydrogenase family protein, partial [Mycobacterium sp.]